MALLENIDSSDGPFKSLCCRLLVELWGITEETVNLLREIEESRKGRNLDFYIVPGATVLRFPLENQQIFRNEIRIPVLSAGTWENLIRGISESPLLLSYLNSEAERRPWIIAAMDQLLEKILRQTDDLAVKPVFMENDEELQRINERAIMAIYKTLKKIEADPLTLLTLYGKGTEELLAEYKERRFEVISKHSSIVVPPVSIKVETERTESSSTLAAPQSLSQEVLDLKFPLKADELPGLILRRFDPIPITGAEEALDKLTEEAYDKISRRAQIRGLAFR